MTAQEPAKSMVVTSDGQALMSVMSPAEQKLRNEWAKEALKKVADHQTGASLLRQIGHNLFWREFRGDKKFEKPGNRFRNVSFA